jgi:hypothetical protein
MFHTRFLIPDLYDALAIVKVSELMVVQKGKACQEYRRACICFKPHICTTVILFLDQGQFCITFGYESAQRLACPRIAESLLTA